MLAARVHIDAQDVEGETALHYAVARDDKKVVAALLAGGSNPMVADIRGQTAIHLAIKSNSTQIVSMFVKANPPGV